VRSPGSRRGHGESWRRSFRGAGNAIDSTERRIAICRRIIDDCETILAEHPMLATHKMQRASGLLCEAAERLERSIVCMSATNARIAEAPADANEAPARMIAAMERWIEAARQLAMISNRFDEAFAALSDYINSGTAPIDISELLKRRVHPVPVLARHPAPQVLSIENDRIFCIHLRRQRSVRVTVAEAPRRVSRGRAPPLVSTCSL
jgi:hypothetical protein